MGGFTTGLVIGLLVGVSGTFLLLSIGAAFSMERARLFRLRSIPGTLVAALALLAIAVFCRRLAIGKDAAMLLLLFAVLGISKVEGLLSGLIATALATLMLAFGFMPPIGSLMIRSSSDRLAIALFLLIGTIGSRIIGSRHSSPS